MKLLFLTNNPISEPLRAWLAAQPERDEIIIRQEKLAVADLIEVAPHLVISYSYRHILRAEVLNALPGKFINLHISRLPFNRGADPNAWSFLEDTPKGVTLHLIDEGVDTGPVLAQREVSFDESRETLGHSYAVLHDEMRKLFQETWPALRAGQVKARPQAGPGTFHYLKEFAAIKESLLGGEGWDVPIPLFKKRFLRLRRPT